MITNKYKIADIHCTKNNCPFGEEFMSNIESARRKAKYHCKTTGHEVILTIQTTYEFNPSK